MIKDLPLDEKDPEAGVVSDQIVQLGARKQWHWLAENPNGVGIQLYSAMIAALLLSRRLGKLPKKRIDEALKFHQSGWASDEELIELLPQSVVKKPN